MRLELPTLQNWSCHNCAGCCKQHLIEVTEEERLRIVSQDWTPADGVPADRPVLVWHAGPLWKKRYRLGHRSDGGCVFLNEQGLCRIHAKFGEAAKPLPCRIYPYAFHPAGGRLAVSLRFSCPSVTANRGTAVAAQRPDLTELATLAVPKGAENLPPPRLTRLEQVGWDDFQPFVEALDESFADPTAPLQLRLLRILTWTGIVEQSHFATISGPQLQEFLGIIRQAAAVEHARFPTAVAPSRVARLDFRILAAAYTRKDTIDQLNSGWWGRYRLLRAILRFLRGTGELPAMQEELPAVRFEAIEAPMGRLTPGMEELFERYFRVKIQGLHFCGRGFYDAPLTEGVASLVLMFPITLWLARWVAAGKGRSQPIDEDVNLALNLADHNHGFSGLLGQGHMRTRVRRLAQTGGLATLCSWYARHS